MIPLKYSFRLLSRAEIKKIRFASDLKKINFTVSELGQDSQKSEELETENKKRMFLKLAGVVGLGAVASLLLPKRAEALVFGSTPASNVVGVKDSANTRISPAKEDGNLASIKTSTDPLVAAGAGGYIRQDSTATIAKETGGNLAAIAGKDFATQTTLATLATEDSSFYLRRIAKLTESLGTIDSVQRQKVTVEGATITSGTITTVATTTNLVALGGVDGRYLYIDTARNAYANGIRSNLINS